MKGGKNVSFKREYYISPYITTKDKSDFYYYYYKKTNFPNGLRDKE